MSNKEIEPTDGEALSKAENSMCDPQWCECSDYMSSGIPCPPGQCPNARQTLANTESLTGRDLMDPTAFMKQLLGPLAPLLEGLSLGENFSLPFQTPDLFSELYSYNDDGSLNVTLEVPGIKQEDLSVHMHDERQVTVVGETKTATSTHSVEDAFVVPEGFKLEPVQHLENGILTLTFPLVK